MAWIGKWDGGRVWQDKRGRKRYVIRRMVLGKMYELSTGATTVAGAAAALRRFEENPEAFRAPDVTALTLDAELAKRFLDWSLNEKRNTAAWVEDQKSTLGWWADRFGTKDLRRLSLRDDVLATLPSAGRGRRIRVLKALYGWLRKVEHRINAAEDPTYGTLSAPPNRPAQWKRSKVVPEEHVALALEHLVDPFRSALAVQAVTGWHVTEILRFAESGRIEAMPRGRDGKVLVCPRHKGGQEHRTHVDVETARAAERLLGAALTDSTYRKAIASACRAARIPAFAPGRMRHTMATRAINAGAPAEAVSLYLGHLSSQTTKRFYATYAVPPRPLAAVPPAPDAPPRSGGSSSSR